MIDSILSLASTYYGPIFCAALLFIFIRVSWRGINSWPLTCYPMFAKAIPIEDASGLRLAIKYKNGDISWWNPPFPRLIWRFNLEFQKTGIHLIEKEILQISDTQKKLFELARSGLTQKECLEVDEFLLILRQSEVDQDGNFFVTDTKLVNYSLHISEIT